jgi:regulator of sigma E protease
MNFVLAAAIFAVMFVAVGVPVIDPTIGRMTPDSAAAQAGLRLRDQVVAIDGTPVGDWREIDEAVSRAGGRALAFAIMRDGARQDVTVTPRKVPAKTPFNEPDEVWSIGARPYTAPVVGEVLPGRPAAAVGLQPKDRIVTLNGQPIETWEELAEGISTRADQALTLGIERAGARMDISVTPKAEVDRDALGNETKGGRIGIAPTSESYRRYGPRPPSCGVVPHVGRHRHHAVSMWKLVTGKIPASNLGGPIQIRIVVSQAAQRGWRDTRSSWRVSINLAILNLHRSRCWRRSPPVLCHRGGAQPATVPPEAEIAQQVGLALLLLLMGFALQRRLARPGDRKFLR